MKTMTPNIQENTGSVTQILIWNLLTKIRFIGKLKTKIQNWFECMTNEFMNFDFLKSTKLILIIIIRTY